MIKDKLSNGEELSEDKFKAPSREFGIMPFWFWNGEMEYNEMEYQLKEYYDKGVPGIIIHARFGIKDYMPYLSEEWFNKVRFTVEKAKEIGLQVWVYDEYNWPSGTAGHQVMEADPDLTQRYLELVEMTIPGQFFTFLEGTDSRYIDMEQSEPIYACAILEEDLKNGRPNFIDLMPSLSFDKVITWEAPKGPWRLFYFIERKASWYIDTLDENSTGKFLELTHERYKSSMKGSFEGNIRGFYTDEPAMHYFEVGKDNYIIPWSKKLFKIFRDANGYDLKPHLAKLFYDFGADTEQIRFDFWSTLTKQYEKAFYKRISDWCRENQVLFTGHLLFEEWLRMHARSGGNLFNYLRHMDIIGVDHLYPRIGTREMPDEHVAIKIGSSAAHQFGSTRLLCESLGGSYWDVTMERMKWIADWEYVLGVNLFNPHGFHYSIEGERKRDWPPSQFYHHTWWEQYKLFNDYLSRMGYLLSGGKHIAKVAILYPINSIWANYTPQARNALGNVIEYDFNYLTDTLLRLHVDFDYIDEDVLKDVEIIDGKLCIRDEAYSLLLLPPVTHIKESTIKLIEDFYANGGRILADTLLPCDCVDGDSNKFKGRISKIFGVDPAELKQSYIDKQKTNCSITQNNNDNGGKVLLIQGPGLSSCKPKELLRSAVLECIKPDIEIDNEDVFYLHRVKDGKDFYFIINPVEDGKEITITVDAEGMPELWNLENGDISQIKVFKIHGGKTGFKLHMEPYGSVMVSMSACNGRTYAEESNITISDIDTSNIIGYGRVDQVSMIVNKAGQRLDINVRGEQPLTPVEFARNWAFKTSSPNALLINVWKAAIDEDGDGYNRGYADKDFDDSSWMDFRMGAWEMQLPNERDQRTYPVTLWYRTSFEADYIPEDMNLLIDGFKGAGYELYINGRLVTETPVRSHLDAEIKAVAIKHYLCKGRNNISVKLIAEGKSHGILDLLKLTGAFALQKSNTGYKVVAPPETIETGSWVKQGYPYFSGSGVYTQKLNINKDYMEKVLKLNVQCGTDIFEVDINGQKAGIRMWNPYELDVTPYIHEGENTFSIKITNTLINVLEGIEKESGLFDVRITPYNRYEIKF